MKLGARIRKIRMFRNITQKELGRRLGYGESSADVRIAQYESGQRTPKQETLIRIAEILEVDVRNFLSPGIATMDELMETLFWMDEENRGLFHLFLHRSSSLSVCCYRSELHDLHHRLFQADRCPYRIRCRCDHALSFR